MPNVEKLTDFQQEELLRFFLYQMPMEQRWEVMARYPQTYRALYGTDTEHILRQVTNRLIEKVEK